MKGVSGEPGLGGGGQDPGLGEVGTTGLSTMMTSGEPPCWAASRALFATSEVSMAVRLTITPAWEAQESTDSAQSEFAVNCG